MAKVILRQEAIDDLNTIWDYTLEKWSEQQADKYYATVKMACNGIGENPHIGKEYDGIFRNLLGLKLKPLEILNKPNECRLFKLSMQSFEHLSLK